MKNVGQAKTRKISEAGWAVVGSSELRRGQRRRRRRKSDEITRKHTSKGAIWNPRWRTAREGRRKRKEWQKNTSPPRKRDDDVNSTDRYKWWGQPWEVRLLSPRGKGSGSRELQRAPSHRKATVGGWKISDRQRARARNGRRKVCTRARLWNGHLVNEIPRHEWTGDSLAPTPRLGVARDVSHSNTRC